MTFRLTLRESSSSSVRLDLFAISQSSVTRGSLNSAVSTDIREEFHHACILSNTHQNTIYLRQRFFVSTGAHRCHHCIPHGWFCGVGQSPGWGLSFSASNLNVFDGARVLSLHPLEDLLHFYGSLKNSAIYSLTCEIQKERLWESTKRINILSNFTFN